MATNTDSAALITGNTAFAFDLYRQLSERSGNLLFSPYSLSVALAMAHAGARHETERQMAQTLHFTLEPARLHLAFAALQDRLTAVQQAGHVKLGIANSIWPQERYPFVPEYIACLKECYGVEVTPLDYVAAFEAARKTINDWVEAKTEKKIVELISEGVLNPLTRLVLVNAIYFKGNWARQFNPKHTHDVPFWITPGEFVTVPMMHQTTSLKHGTFGSLQVLELPYEGNDLSMLVLLPDKIDGLAELEATLTVEQLTKWTRQLWEVEVEVCLPKFKTEFAITLNDVLKDLGMPDAFDKDHADFSGMDGAKWLYITATLHKAFIDVNEEGTEAAAATGVLIGARSTPRPPVAVRVDHPFSFLIRDNNTGSILFMGRMTNPLG